ncbi:Uncharacterised protein [Mycobacteroides abscessus subsp. abscessus]|nr:Uncharacterised protein [Mycobacteroides abscessus subsp. abscessus]
MGAHDRRDDRETESDSGMPVVADAVAAALERFGERGRLRVRDHGSRVLDDQRRVPIARSRPHLDDAVFGRVVDDRVVDEVARHLGEQHGVTAHRCALGVDGDAHAPLIGEGHEGLDGVLGEEGEVARFGAGGLAAGTAEQEQRLGECDRAGVDGPEPVEVAAHVPVGVLCGDVEDRLRDRQRGPQFVGGVRGEALLLTDVGLDAVEHRIEDVGEFADLVAAPAHPDPMRELTAGHAPGGAGDLRERGEHASGEDPAAEEADDEEEAKGGRGGGEERPLQVGAVGHEAVGGADGDVRDVAQEEDPHDGEEEDAGDDEEPRVAEGELPSHAHSRPPRRGLLTHRSAPARPGSRPRGR